MQRFVDRLSFFAALCAVGCSCGAADALRVNGDTDHGYVRCLAGDPPSERSFSAGDVRVELEDRELRISNASKIAFAAGPGDADLSGAIRRLRERGASVLILVGDLGSTRERATAQLRALARIGIPVLVVAGGADSYAVLEGAFSEVDEDRVIHASTLRSIRIGSVELVPLAGAPLGRYALSNDSCGFSEDDIGDIADDLGAPEAGIIRYLLSWAAPTGVLGLVGVDAGSPQVTRLADRTEARGAIFAWPRSDVAERGDVFRLGLGPLAGTWSALPDGSRRPPGATLLTASARGLLPAASR